MLHEHRKDLESELRVSHQMLQIKVDNEILKERKNLMKLIPFNIDSNVLQHADAAA